MGEFHSLGARGGRDKSAVMWREDFCLQLRPKNGTSLGFHHEAIVLPPAKDTALIPTTTTEPQSIGAATILPTAFLLITLLLPSVWKVDLKTPISSALPA